MEEMEIDEMSIDDIVKGFELFCEEVAALIPKNKKNFFISKKDDFISNILKEKPKLAVQFSQTMTCSDIDREGDKLAVNNLQIKKLKLNNERKILKSRKIAKDLLIQKINSKIPSNMNQEKPTINPNNEFDISILKNLCNSLFSEISKNEYSMKVKYYEMGMYLLYSKRYCEFKKFSFIDFIESHLTIKSLSQINTYIRFYQICQKYNCLIWNEITMTEIMNNFKEIENILKESSMEITDA
jgi:hypothetical protein